MTEQPYAPFAPVPRVNVTGEQRVAQEPNELFQDSFDTPQGALDTANRWVAPTASGTGAIAAAWSAGGVLLTGGTAANAFSDLHSQQAFPPIEPGYLQASMRVQVEAPVLTLSYRFWGLGATTGTPTFAAPVTDGAGFEIASSGKMFAVSWSGGVRNVIADLSAGSGSGVQPLDGATHKYFLFFRGDQAYWAIDNIDSIVASMLTGAPGPLNNVLPLKFIAVSNGGTAATISVAGCSAGDTARNNLQVSDGLYPWRKQRVASQVSTLSNVASAAADTLLLAANPNRAAATIWNDSTATLFVNLGTTVSSATNYTAQVLTQAGYTVPATWTGMVRGIWASANGFARVTELT
jgi:hypothetical protein